MSRACSCLVVGSGIAGLTCALEAAEQGGEVLLVTKRSRGEANTTYAQGGLAAVLSPTDSFAAHVHDTLVAGAGLCHPKVVAMCVQEAPACVAFLEQSGVALDRQGAAFDLHLEGGHSARRIVHAGDATGQEIMRALLERVQASSRIHLLEEHMVIDLLVQAQADGAPRCVGAYVLNERTGGVETLLAQATVLATGGAGKVYLYTSNPDIATGDGVAIAYRAGAEIANMEFYQFHPTCLYHPQAKNFLVSEVLRGEGAVLRLQDGTPFMPSFHPLGDLAPRDVVARAIDFEMKRTGAEYVLLDITHRPASFVRERFPTIAKACATFGIDITREPIPVVPAAHYQCGGVVTDSEGRTRVPGLWAVGECASTGLHGANRLASNSLLEGLVFGRRAGRAVGQERGGGSCVSVPEWSARGASLSEEAVIITQNWDELRRVMWNYVGIVRSDRRLARAARRLALFQEEIRAYYWDYFVTRDLLELRNIATVAQLMVEGASARRESRGLHCRIDLPEPGPTACDTILRKDVPPLLRRIPG